MYEKIEGIILRETEYKDADKLLTVLTREHGKLTLRARGVKSGRSRSKAACQFLTYSEFTVSEKQGKYTITEAVVKEMFPELREDIELLYLASYFAQVTDAVAQEEDASPELLSLLLNALYALAKLEKPQKLVKAVFELRLACIAGFLPDLRGCAVCGNPNPNRFNVTQGILQCAECRNDATDGIRMPVSEGSLAAMRYIASADPKRLFAFTLSDGALQELNGLTESYLTMRLERGFFTLDLYKSLFL
ncbi:MAG: DNA repair protein RecO [Faecousia sp.]